jgi:hypothetical protein
MEACPPHSCAKVLGTRVIQVFGVVVLDPNRHDAWLASGLGSRSWYHKLRVAAVGGGYKARSGPSAIKWAPRETFSPARAIHEKGGLNLASLDGEQQIEAEDNYRSCVKHGAE